MCVPWDRRRPVRFLWPGKSSLLFPGLLLLFPLFAWQWVAIVCVAVKLIKCCPNAGPIWRAPTINLLLDIVRARPRIPFTSCECTGDGERKWKTGRVSFCYTSHSSNGEKSVRRGELLLHLNRMAFIISLHLHHLERASAGGGPAAQQ